MTAFIRRLVLLLAVTAAFASSAHAVLYRVGPTDVPSPPGTGYPFWYQDFNGLALDLCLPTNQAQLDAGACLILPPAQDPAAGLNLPIVFPTNFPDEAFWWNSGGVIDFGGGNRAVLVMALEAAFGGGAVAVNDQISFGRLRIIVDAPVSGNYTVTTPYGVRNFPNVEAGPRAITFTSDIGIAVGDFHGALQSDIGPFLVAADAPGGNPLPYVTIGGEQFLADTAAPVFVTGSPNGTNYFEVCVDNQIGLDGAGNQCMLLDQFTLMGKVHTGPLGSPLVVDRATYSRYGGIAKVDVFANASAAPNAAQPVLALSDGIDNTVMPPRVMNGPTSLGQFYGQGTPASARAIPAAVTVTNTADQPPSSVVQPLIDHVEITRAAYDPATGTLSITATSSDKGDPAAPAIAPPGLTAVGLPGSATGSDPLTPVGGLDPAEMTISYTLPAPLPPGGPVPPATVTVTSTAGGIDTETVSFPLQAPLSAVSLAANPASPQTAGTSVLFTATPTGGIAPVQYEFQARAAGSTTWLVARGYLDVNTFTWITTGVPAGNYEWRVLARSAGSTAASEAISPTLTYTLTVLSTAPTAATLTAVPADNATAGTQILFTGAATNGTAPFEYQFEARAVGQTGWTVARGYDPTNTFTWNSTGAPAGGYEWRLLVRRAGSVAASEAISPTLTYTILGNLAATGVTLGADNTVVTAGTPVLFTAVGSGGTGPYEYQFQGRAQGQTIWNSATGYGAATFSWNTNVNPGAYEWRVNVRRQGSTAASEATSTPVLTITVN